MFLVSAEHVAKEMLYLCEIIRDYGYRSKEGQVKITFGKLFSVYQYISDKVSVDVDFAALGTQ